MVVKTSLEYSPLKSRKLFPLLELDPPQSVPYIFIIRSFHCFIISLYSFIYLINHRYSNQRHDNPGCSSGIFTFDAEPGDRIVGYDHLAHCCAVVLHRPLSVAEEEERTAQEVRSPLRTHHEKQRTNF